MPTSANQDRLIFGLGVVALALALFTWTAIVSFVIRQRQITHYPGAQMVSDHSIYKAFPQPIIRRDTSYNSQDDFPAVYNWYSNGFNLGPERQAQSSCIHLFGTTSWLVFVRNISVTVCDTPNGRLIFAQHSILFDYR